MRYTIASTKDYIEIKILDTLHPVYIELAYSEYPVIMNGFLRTDC
jgi:hypothetical protein